MIEELIETWRINERVTLRLIEHISDEGMRCTLSTRGGRNVVRQFAHIHNNRLYQLEARAKPLAQGALGFATHDEPDRDTLVAALEDSSGRVEQWIRKAGEGASKIRTCKRGLIANIAYLIAHESHHRGSILLTLKQSGHRLDPAVQYSIWDWDRI